MPPLAFDTLKQTQRLKGAAVPADQAEVQIEVLRDVITGVLDASGFASAAAVQDVQADVKALQTSQASVLGMLQDVKTDQADTRSALIDVHKIQGQFSVDLGVHQTATQAGFDAARKDLEGHREATQAGFDAARKDLEAHQAATRAEFKLARQEIAATEERLSAKIDAMENCVVVKLGKTIVSSISLACAVLTVVIAGVGLAVKYL